MRWKSHSLWISLLGLIVGAKSSYGPDGNGTAAATSQDAITDTNATATSNTFFPFYLEVTVPTFCTRGDKIIVDASATNHQEKCIKVQFTLGVSNGSVPIPLNDSSRICICKGQRVSQRWSLDLTLLGDINITASASTTFNSTSANNCDEKLNDSEPHYTDTVMETIRVEAEGIKRKVTSSYLVIMESK
ncbi:hypothetical protein GDO81_004050 [Engystomops pustulosus]|uniref:Alpha-2-macroglobulin domain-containing protein n=1 Tax=Engystomops pustulosus TaxID=76066 RepID=A0AAV6ZUN8_ENGPU|nr:hypothetical protein GDO81_004050 [Engystomops pustulosus]